MCKNYTGIFSMKSNWGALLILSKGQKSNNMHYLCCCLLQDILENDDLQIDDMFIASLVFDIIRVGNPCRRTQIQTDFIETLKSDHLLIVHGLIEVEL